VRVSSHVEKAEILEQAAGLVKEGGRLVYSTCTLRRAENECVAEAFASGVGRGLGFLPWDFVDEAPWAGTVRGNTATLAPHTTGTDGFFIARWRRGGSCDDG
jgi:16S rRNA (cytosine967-C5)-methyltransferase